jgi:hypothetical protein
MFGVALNVGIAVARGAEDKASSILPSNLSVADVPRFTGLKGKLSVTTLLFCAICLEEDALELGRLLLPLVIFAIVSSNS